MRRSTRWVCSIALALFLGPAAIAHADGKRDLEDGIAFYENLDSERAIERLRAASDAKDLSAKDRAKALLYLGMVHFENGDRAPALESWKKSFALDRNVAVPQGTSPKTIEAIEAARSESAPAPAPPSKPKDNDEPGGARKSASDGAVTPPGDGNGSKRPAASPAGSPASSSSQDTAALPTAPQSEPNELITTTTQAPPPEEDDDSLATWLIVGGIGAALAGAAIVTLLVVSGGGDCTEGGCLTVTFE